MLGAVLHEHGRLPGRHPMSTGGVFPGRSAPVREALVLSSLVQRAAAAVIARRSAAASDTHPGSFIMGITPMRTTTGSLSSLPSRRDVLRGLASAGLVMTAMGDENAAARKRHHQKRKHKPKPKLPPPPPLPFNEFGCLDIGQPCQGDSSLCCSGVCDPGTSTCVAHNSGVCFPDTDSCTLQTAIPCHPSNTFCSCRLTTGNAGFCADFSDLSEPTDICRFCGQDTDCQEEFGPGAACIVLKGICSSFCAATGRTACVRPCV